MAIVPLYCIGLATAYLSCSFVVGLIVGAALRAGERPDRAG